MTDDAADRTAAQHPLPLPDSPTESPEAPTPDPALTRAWQRTIAALPQSQRAWLRASQPLTVHGSTLIVAVTDEFTRSQLETRLRSRLDPETRAG